MKLITSVLLFAALGFSQNLVVLPFNYNSANLSAFSAFAGHQIPNIQVWIMDSVPGSATYQVTVYYRDQSGIAQMDTRAVSNQKSPTGITIIDFLHDDSELDMVVVQPPTGLPAVWQSSDLMTAAAAARAQPPIRR